MSGPDSAQLLSERFATHALETRFEDLTDDAIAQAKIFILDTIGVGISGSSAFGADKLLQVSLNDGEGSASIWGRDDKISAKTAALVNGYQIHCQEYDCVHEGAVLHPLATTLPAVIAYAETTGCVSGRDLITAAAIGQHLSWPRHSFAVRSNILPPCDCWRFWRNSCCWKADGSVA